jgi:O-antigen/teichoic acid export membrane protein
VRHALLTFSANVGVAVLSFANVIVITRSLGATGRGQFVFLIAMANLTHYACTFGLQSANSNLASRHPELRGALAANSLIAAGVFGLFGIGVIEVLVAVFPGVGGGTTTLWRLVALSAVPVLILQNYTRSLVQAASRFSVTNVGWVVGPLLNVAANGALALAGILTVHRALLIWLAGQAAGTAFIVVYHAARISRYDAPNRALARGALGFGLRSHAGDVMMLGNYRLDQWILGAVRSKADLGVYSVAVALAETLFYLPEAVKQVARPRLARASREHAAAVGAVVFRLTVVATALIAVPLVVFAPLVTRIFFGAAFEGAAPQLRVLVAGAFGVLALKVLGTALTAQQRPGLESLVSGIAFAATIVLDVLLIPHHAGMGAAIASTTAYLFGGAAVAAVYVRVLGAPAGSLVPRWAELRELGRGRRAAGRVSQPSQES